LKGKIGYELFFQEGELFWINYALLEGYEGKVWNVRRYKEEEDER